jgi:hypothetical protein
VSLYRTDPEPLDGITWSQFLIALRRGSSAPRIRAWQPGSHVALIGPTGEGKTTFAVGLLKLRKYVLALDPKGGDTTLARSGFTRITSLPPPGWVQDDLAEGKPVRLIVGHGEVRTAADDTALEQLIRDALDYARHSGGWTLYVDEYQLTADQRMFRLGTRIERMLITARDQGTSVVTSFQALAWVPRAAVRQLTAFAVLFATRDRDMIKAVASAMGRDWRQVVAIIDRLSRDERAEFCCLVIPRSLRDPMLIVRAAEV